ncbi:MAG: hypothetical protein R3A13_04465 [Bdellovibrionota bacterium]
MTYLSESAGLGLLAAFGVAMISLVWFKTHAEDHSDGFLVADRNVSLWNGAFSIAVSWIWAPAIFICSLQAFTKGLPGIFWFTLPNIICFFIFAPMAVRFRRLVPKAYTLPEFIFRRFNGHKTTHIAYLILFLGYQLGAVIINSLAGGTLLHAVSGIDINTAIISMSAIALCYSLISGLKASVFTDVIQMSMVLLIGLILVPFCIAKAGGISSITSGLGGVDGTHTNLFDPWIAFTMGIPMTLGLIAGPISDQMFFQRALAVKEKYVVKTFVYGGLLFGVVPIILSLLGFVGADLVRQGLITVDDPQMISPAVIGYLLPNYSLFAFCLMAFAGLCSTMDSGFCAGSSLGAIDIYKRYIKPDASDKQILKYSRIFMVFMATLGTAIALLKPTLLWTFLIYGAIGSAGMFPTILALYWNKLTAKGAMWAVSLSLLIGTPLSIYANVNNDPYLVVVAAITSVLVGLIICLVSGFANKDNHFDFKTL